MITRDTTGEDGLHYSGEKRQPSTIHGAQHAGGVHEESANENERRETNSEGRFCCFRGRGGNDVYRFVGFLQKREAFNADWESRVSKRKSFAGREGGQPTPAEERLKRVLAEEWNEIQPGGIGASLGK